MDEANEDLVENSIGFVVLAWFWFWFFNCFGLCTVWLRFGVFCFTAFFLDFCDYEPLVQRCVFS